MTQKLSDRLASLRVGDPLDKNTDLGAINSSEQLGTISKYLDIGASEGAVRHDPSPSEVPDKWVLVQAVLLYRGAAEPHDCSRRDLRSCARVDEFPDTPDEALSRANNTPYGLAAGSMDGQGIQDL